MIRKMVFLFGALIVLSCSGDDAKSNVESEFIKGMDLSFQPELENYNVTYKDENGNPVELLPFVSEKGTNLIRLRLWHTPQNGLNGLSQVKAYALKIKQQNLKFMLDIHFSDTWADPGSQTPPESWQNLTLEEIKNEVYFYTKEVLTQLKTQNTTPEFVQIGNETDSGFLWNYGKVWDEFNDNWANYAALVNKASQAVREVTGNETLIILHHSSVENASYFFEELANFSVDYDVIGLSYYPQFQTKDLNLVQSKLNTLADTFDKKIMIIEIAYPFTLEWQDNAVNYIGFQNQIIPQYPATPQGQKDFLQKIASILKNIPNNKGIGFCYWAPDWVAFPGNETTSTAGSAWENQCLWDFDHKALPALEVFSEN